MSKLIYSTTMSLDGYSSDSNGGIEWSAPDAEVFSFVSDVLRGIGTYLFGRRMYETMLFWETFAPGPNESQGLLDYAEIWKAVDKVVYSKTLGEPTSVRTRIERSFDPRAVLEIKQSSTSDICVGGADLASQALAAGLVDEVHLFVRPVTLGGGFSALPPDFSTKPELLSVDRFASGVVHLLYRTTD